MEDISGDQWEHFAAVSRNDPVTQDLCIQQHSPALSKTAPLGPDGWAGGCVYVFACINFTVYKWMAAALGAFECEMDFLVIQG